MSGTPESPPGGLSYVGRKVGTEGVLTSWQAAVVHVAKDVAEGRLNTGYCQNIPRIDPGHLTIVHTNEESERDARARSQFVVEDRHEAMPVFAVELERSMIHCDAF